MAHAECFEGSLGFLGLTGYYRKYVKGYADIAFPLTHQLKKDSLGWNLEAQQVFDKLKDTMTTTLVMALSDSHNLSK